MDFLTEITTLAALAVVAVQQILKLDIIPVYFANKYPVLTNIGLSIVAAVFVKWQGLAELTVWTDWVVYVTTVVVLAAVTYNMTLRNSPEIQNVSRKNSPINY